MKCSARQLTRGEYLAEMERTHGSNARKWRCKCPVCGIEYSLEEVGNTREEAERGLWGCIGRVNGKGGDAFGERPHNEHGCNFAANGLFRSPWLLFDEKVGVGNPSGVMPIAAAVAVTAPAQGGGA